MKKIFILLVGISLVITTTIFATNPPSAAKLPSDFKQEITKHIHYPSFARNNLVEGVVTMRITLNDSLKVKIIDLSATNPDLGAFVRKELADVTINNTSFQPGNIYYMKVRFNIISGF